MQARRYYHDHLLQVKYGVVVNWSIGRPTAILCASSHLLLLVYRHLYGLYIHISIQYTTCKQELTVEIVGI